MISHKRKMLVWLLGLLALFGVFFGFVCSSLCFVASAEAQDVIYVVTANSAVVFESPDLNSEKIVTLKNKEEVLLLMNAEMPERFEGNGFVFFKTETFFETENGEKQGYILSDLVTKKTNVIVSIPYFNAKTNSACKLFLKENDEIKESEITLEKGTQVFLYEGFVSKNKFTAVALFHDNQVIYGFLETKNINPNGINPMIITCICLILALLGIIFAWLFMKNKKKKIKLKTNTSKL